MKQSTCVWLLAILASASSAGAAEAPRYGMPWDWSHRAHIVSPEAEGAEREPRYVTQMLQKVESRMARDAADATEAELALARQSSGPQAKALVDRLLNWLRNRGRGASNAVTRDWSYVMGGGNGVGVNGVFPAKYAFDISSTPSCVNDFVVYGSGAAGATGSGNFATRLSTTGFSGNTGNGTVTITNGARSLVITRTTNDNTGLNFIAANGTANATKAANLADAINRNGGVVGVTASVTGTQVRVTAMMQGTGANAIVLGEDLNNFAWTGTGDANVNLAGGTGTAGQPTIFAFNQLYKTTCGGVTGATQVPNVYWSYNTGTGGVVETSPVLSLDGTQVAFIERTGATASLVILKWAAGAGNVAAPTVPTLAGSGAAYRACVAPCMYKLSLGASNVTTITGFDGVTTNTWGSSPYYDYGADSLYVGTATGVLRKYNGIFIGNPAAAGAPWPVTVAAGLQLSSPVYDGSALVYVGSARSAGIVGVGTGGRLHSVSAAGAVVSSAELASGPFNGTGGTGVADAPIIDTSAQRAYVFVASNTVESCGGTAAECEAVYQIPINVSIAGASGTMRTVGRGELRERIQWMGSFSDAYWSSTPSSPTGHLYACGSEPAGNSSRRPTLWRIPITANVMGAAVAGPTVVNADATECSPITTIANGASEFLFVSVPAGGNASGCTGACVYMFNLAGAWSTGKAASAGLPAPGGTGGIIIDNISSATGASQVYYGTRTAPGNAIQASQAALN